MTDAQVWIAIVGIGAGTFLLRFSFLGLIGNRPMPPAVLRHLRYAAVAILPGLVAPLVLWPQATGGHPDAARLLAAIATLAIGWWRGGFIWGMVAGAATLYGVLALARLAA